MASKVLFVVQMLSAPTGWSTPCHLCYLVAQLAILLVSHISGLAIIVPLLRSQFAAAEQEHGSELLDVEAWVAALRRGDSRLGSVWRAAQPRLVYSSEDGELGGRSEMRAHPAVPTAAAAVERLQMGLGDFFGSAEALGPPPANGTGGVLFWQA